MWLLDHKKVELAKITPSPKHKVAPRPQTRHELNKQCQAKNAPQIVRSALSGDPTAVTLVTNHSIFIKGP